MLRQGNECWETQWNSPDLAHCLSYQGNQTRVEGERGTAIVKNDKQIFLSFSDWTQTRDWLEKLHFLFPIVHRIREWRLKIAAKTKKIKKKPTKQTKNNPPQKKNKNKKTTAKPIDWNEAISYWFTRIISLISRIVTGCTRHRSAALCQPNSSMWMQQREQRTGGLSSLKHDCTKEP